MCGMARKASKYMSNNKGVGEGKGLRKCMAGVGCNGGTKKKKKPRTTEEEIKGAILGKHA